MAAPHQECRLGFQKVSRVGGGSYGMIRGVRLAFLGALLLALDACAVPDRQPDLDNIAANVEQTQEGDFGESLTNMNEPGDKPREAQEIHDDLAQQPLYPLGDRTERER